MTKQELQQHLYTGNTHVFAILDGASIDDLRQRLYETSPPHFCLFRGELTPDLAEAAPYLVGLSANSLFTDWVLGEGFGKHWGIFAHSRQSIKEMRRHFRSIVTVNDESGKPMIFRFYDPRVLRTYLPTCTPDELKSFFGSVDSYFAEDSDGQNLLAFKVENNELKQAELK